MNKYATIEQAEEWVSEYMHQKEYVCIEKNSYNGRAKWINKSGKKTYDFIPKNYTFPVIAIIDTSTEKKFRPYTLVEIPSSKEDFLTLIKILD